MNVEADLKGNWITYKTLHSVKRLKKKKGREKGKKVMYDNKSFVLCYFMLVTVKAFSS